MRSYKMAVAIASITAIAATADAATSLYIRSLDACVQAKQEVDGNLSAVLVVKNVIVGDPTFFYPVPSEVGTTRLEYLDTPSILKKFRQAGKPFSAIEVKPMINRDDTLIVDCADYQVSVSKGRPVLSVIGGTRIHWRFDAANRDYSMTRAERWRPQM
jgi:hypothetical protein